MANIIRWEHKQFAIHMMPRLKQLEEHCRKRGIQMPEPPPCQSPRNQQLQAEQESLGRSA